VEQGLTELRYKKSSCEDRRAENLKNPSLWNWQGNIWDVVQEEDKTSGWIRSWDTIFTHCGTGKYTILGGKKWGRHDRLRKELMLHLKLSAVSVRIFKINVNFNKNIWIRVGQQERYLLPSTSLTRKLGKNALHCQHGWMVIRSIQSY
jgi:hypothetical protein